MFYNKRFIKPAKDNKKRDRRNIDLTIHRKQ